jgi:hypothetical protein
MNLASSYSLTFPGGGTESTNLMLDKLSFHLAQQPGIIGIESLPVNGEPTLRVYFNKSLTIDKSIHEILNSATISNPNTDGSLITISNPLSFPFRGETILK